MNDSKFINWLFESKTGQTFIVINGFFILLILKFFIEMVKSIPVTINVGQIAIIIVFIIFDVIFFLDFLSHKKDNKIIN